MSGSQYSGPGSFMGEMHPTSWAIPQEKTVKTSQKKTTLRIGLPKESRLHENRISLSPESVGVLVANGHQVYVQQDAGKASSFLDKAYSDAGAIICYTLADVYSKSDVITKISPLTDEELGLLKQNQVLLSAVNLGSLTPDYLKHLIKKNISAVGYEFIKSEDSSTPLVQLMAEIAGVSSIHIASELMTGIGGGKGQLLGGITGVPPSTVTIIGAGTVGYHAARTALGMGAVVKVIDSEVYKLRKLERELGVTFYTAVAQENYIRDAVSSSDVVIGAAYNQGRRAPIVVTEDMVLEMREGSVIVDVAIDQGGCVETSRVTSHEKPTFTEHDVIHYCVPNIASRVPNTASSAISNIVGPLLIQLGDFGGINQLIKFNDGVKEGLYVHRKYLTKQSLASLFGMDYMNISLLIASDF